MAQRHGGKTLYPPKKIRTMQQTMIFLDHYYYAKGGAIMAKVWAFILVVVVAQAVFIGYQVKRKIDHTISRHVTESVQVPSRVHPPAVAAQNEQDTTYLYEFPG